MGEGAAWRCDGEDAAAPCPILKLMDSKGSAFGGGPGGNAPW
jgi:hypothetical protein